MGLFRCVFIFLVAFLSALKVQSTNNFAITYEGELTCQHESDRYLWINCARNDSPQCEARADGSTKGTNSTFLILRKRKPGTRTKYICIQFTDPKTDAKYALKVVNQSRVVFEKHQCDPDGNDPKEFQFKQERHLRFEVYKPSKNQSLCVSKDCVSQKLTLYKYTQNETQDTTRRTTPFDRRCAFTIY